MKPTVTQWFYEHILLQISPKLDANIQNAKNVLFKPLSKVQLSLCQFSQKSNELFSHW